MAEAPSIRHREFAGLNTQADASSLKNNELAVAVNVEVDDAKHLRGRAGLTRLGGTDVHSLFALGDALYYRTGTDLVRHDPVAGTAQVADTGLTGARTAYAGVLDRLFYSDGASARTLSDGEGARDWGVVPPATPAVAAVAGGLLPGAYLVAATYLAGAEESGAATPAQIQLTEGGLRVSVPASAQSGVTAKAIYVSQPGGERLYRVAVVANDGAAVDVGTLIAGVELDGLHKTPPPPCHLASVWNGRTVVGVSNFLLYSDPFRYERFDPLRQSIPLDSAITLFAALGPEAFVVGTERSIYRFTGDITAASMLKIADHGAIAGAATLADGAYVGDASQKLVAVFASPHGLCAVGAAGDVTNLTGKRYAPGPATSGSAVYIPDAGNHRVLFTLQP